MTEPTVPLAERVEYASKGWIAEVKRFLEARADRLPQQPISLSTRLDDPPPHLKNDDNGPFGYTVRLARRSVAVEARPDPKADHFRQRDYIRT